MMGQQLRDRGVEDRTAQRRREREQLVKQQQRNQLKQRARGVFRTLLACLLLLLIGSRLLVTGANANSGSEALDDRIEETVNAYLDASIWRNFKFGINQADLTAHVMRQRPEAGQMTVSLPLLSTKVAVSATERSAAALLTTSLNQQRYVVDKDGVVFSEVSEEAEASSLPLVRDTSGIEPELGQSVAAPAVMEFIKALQQRLPKQGLTPVEYTIGSALRQVDIKVKEVPYVIRASTEQGAGQQLAALRFARAWLKRRDITPKQYLDIRVEDRVYFK